MSKEMKTTKYLYNCNTDDFKKLPYEDALLYKYERAKELLYKIMETNYRERDQERSDAVHKAIKHNMFLINELNNNM